MSKNALSRTGAKAESLIKAALGNLELEGDRMSRETAIARAAVSQAQATIALAISTEAMVEQQKTANLIAAAVHAARSGDIARSEHLTQVVDARLGV